MGEGRLDYLKKLHLVTHTHWDREWYLPFEVFRYRLVGLMDRLVETMEREPDYRFHLDGQMIILEDYLAIRPEKKDRLERLVRSGRLTIGPWYVLVDEYLVSGESIIRNLEEGSRLAAGFGETMKVGYLPDTFGHIGQMPQILKQYGLNHALIWRGLNGSPGSNPSEFWWEAPSGDKVLTIHLPHLYGYTSAMSLPENPSEAADRIRELAVTIGERTMTGHVLLMNGFDHLEPQRNVQAIVDHWNRSENVPITQTTIEDYIRESVGNESAEKSSLPVLAGEFRSTNHQPDGCINAILPGVLSSRVYLKQQNAEMQTLLEKSVEPLQAITYSLWGENDAAFVREAWRLILQNHPHDSICGCSADEVHDEMETRFLKAGQIGRQLVLESLHRVAGRIELSWVPSGAIPVMVYNPLPWRRDAVVDIELDSDDLTVYRSVRVRNEAGDETIGEIVSFKPVCPIQPYSGRYPLGKAETYRHTARIRVDNMPAFGYQLLAVELSSVPRLASLPELTARKFIANEFVRIEVEADGSLTWTDLKSGEVWRGLHWFEDGGDAGDGYTYSRPILDEKIVSCSVQSVSTAGETDIQCRMTLVTALSVPKELRPDGKGRSREMVTMTITTHVMLSAGSRTAAFRTEIDNPARDHRVRLLFRMAKGATPVLAGGAFDIVARSENVRQPNAESWFENEPTTFPFQQFVYADGPCGRFVLTAQGLHEYEWVADGDSQTGEGTLAITMFRAVSHMARADRGMSTSNRAGPGLPAEGAQVLRKLVFDYSLTIGSAAAAIVPWRIADEHAVPALSCRLDAGETAAGAKLPSKRSWLEVDSSQVYVSSIRPMTDGSDGFELRLVNLREASVRTVVKIRMPVKSVQAGSVTGKQLSTIPLSITPESADIEIDLSPKKFVTLFVETERN
ncbi:glycoside hydrolase family 38 C-terminal domain-containing protein [Cohnella sp. REN36]|uniref:alpha-mannosidase n=1 Tax=Cohnella sp. REN36 TaxID=2887347 RepID=UPI001D13F676|nr:glycoside hydrolase family 38 C-terminal domain-containing protein [Cohnella sp. REN36]MCC3375843.1 hypothetical protein [Cohnella sp. REN36]